MKNLLTYMFVGLLMVGCGDSSTHYDPADSAQAIDLDDNETRNRIITEAIDKDKLQVRGKGPDRLAYEQNQQTPYSGWMKRIHDNGQISYLAQYKEGKLDGLWTSWYDDGQKSSEYTYKGGKRDGPLKGWYRNGQKSSEYSHEDGKLWTAVVWKPNGEKCPGTDLVDGNGAWVVYNEDGTELLRQTYKDGKVIRD